jgi:hypothetical protein
LLTIKFGDIFQKDFSVFRQLSMTILSQTLMSSTYRTHVDLLDEDFLTSLKTLYKGRTVEITIEVEQDETERILANPALVSRMEQAVEDIGNGKGIVMPIEQLFRDAARDHDSHSGQASVSLPTESAA